MMVLNVSLLVILLTLVTPVYVREYKCGVECEDYEVVLFCRRDNVVPETPCPTMPRRRCNDGDEVCACPPGKHRRCDNKCVLYKDCVPKAYFIMQFLKRSVTMYMVGITEGLYNGQYRCMKSTFQLTKANEVYRVIAYYEAAEDTITRQYGPEIKEVKILHWERRNIYLLFFLDPRDNHKLVVTNYLETANVPTVKGFYDVVFATMDCLITGKNERNGKYECTMWVPRDLVGNVPHFCAFTFNQTCHNPIINVTQVDEDC